MSWNGTVYCRHCYNKGHNKRTCPDLTETLKRRALQEINDGDGYNGYWGRQYNKRVKKTGLYADGTPMSQEVIQANTRSSKRRCTYCGTQGHNRKTCGELRQDKSDFIEAEINWRKKLKTWAEETGYGVGTLLKTERWGETYAWMVTHVNWNGIASTNVGTNYPVIVQSCRSGSKDNQQLPRIEELSEWSYSRSEVISPVPKVVFPKDFLTEEGLSTPLRKYFDKDKKSENYWENYHN